MRDSKARTRRNERGQAMVEFALVSIAFFLLIFAIFDMTRLFQSWVAVQHASREGARYAITGRAVCDGASGRADCIEWTARKSTAGMFGGGPDGTDVDVETRAWDYDQWAGLGTADATGKQCDQVQVTVSYTHHFVTPLLEAIVPSGIQIKGSQRMTNEPFGICTPGDNVN
ncbi:MAG TPA: TadE family protein [Dehalococcoidia bacterium]|nr:TadE family protein [Dehalococcoidia bacterium]